MYSTEAAEFNFVPQLVSCKNDTSPARMSFPYLLLSFHPCFPCATCFAVITCFSLHPTGHLPYLTMRAFQDMLLGPLKAVLMRVLQQQLSKYIHNIELEELGLMGGDVVLENLGATCIYWLTACEEMLPERTYLSRVVCPISAPRPSTAYRTNSEQGAHAQ